MRKQAMIFSCVTKNKGAACRPFITISKFIFMKHLNKKSTYIFLKLIAKLSREDSIKMGSEGFMPLTLAFLQNVKTDSGEGKLYSLSHTYVQNGGLMRDPEMCFIVVPDPNGFGTLIFPQNYRQDDMGIYEESVYISNGRITGSIALWQQGHCSFANMWLRNILARGFLK